jgi:hypothetical protein
MLEWEWTFCVVLSSLRERVDLLQVLPTQALGRTAACYLGGLIGRSGRRGDCSIARLRIDFWRLFIRKPFRLGFWGWLGYQGRTGTGIASNPFALFRNAVGVFGGGAVWSAGLLSAGMLEF